MNRRNDWFRENPLSMDEEEEYYYEDLDIMYEQQKDREIMADIERKYANSNERQSESDKS